TESERVFRMSIPVQGKMRTPAETCAESCKESVWGMQPARESAIVRADAMAAPEIHVRATAALDDLYRRHVGAEDVTQTTFVNALRALERGEQPRDPSNWLLVIAHNIVRQRWRQAAA